jgi:hypothetical protein
LPRQNRSAELFVFASSFLLMLAIHFAITPHAAAQQFTFQHFDQNEGLKNHDVFKLIQDKTGYLWAATENGLFRYNGAEFHRFGAADGILESLIIEVCQDDSGRILGSDQRPPLLSFGLSLRNPSFRSQRTVHPWPTSRLNRLTAHPLPQQGHAYARPIRQYAATLDHLSLLQSSTNCISSRAIPAAQRLRRQRQYSLARLQPAAMPYERKSDRSAGRTTRSRRRTLANHFSRPPQHPVDKRRPAHPRSPSSEQQLY